MSRNILMPVKTVAEWGGVHEWTVDAAKALIDNGDRVIFVGEGETFRERATRTGADFIPVNWDDWAPTIDLVLNDIDFDLIFSHAPAARQFGLEVNRKANVEHIVMVHGAFHDRMYEWQSEVDAILAASPALVHYAQRFGRVDPWKVTCIPNAAPDEIFRAEPISFEEKLASGQATIMTASRLAPDKVPQIAVVEEAVATLAGLLPEICWNLEVYGDGPSRPYFEARYRNLERMHPNVSVNLPGWIEPEIVPARMREAFLVVTAGMAGMRACASGTLVAGIGARSNVGLQFGRNLRAGLWSNFGDHGTQRFTPNFLTDDLKMIVESNRYDSISRQTRNAVFNAHRQSEINSRMLSALQC